MIKAACALIVFVDAIDCINLIALRIPIYIESIFIKKI
jgi:hypothetical protein